MPSVTAQRQCPDLIFVKPRFEVYKAVSQQIRAIFKRAETSQFHSSEQFQRIAALQYPHQHVARTADANKDRANALTQAAHSDVWRLAGIAFFLLSLATFLFGCGWVAWTLLLAKEVAAKSCGSPCALPSRQGCENLNR
jgi:hypothetical protein